MKTKNPLLFGSARVLAAILISSASAGCVSSKFQKAPVNTPPALPLNIGGPIAPLTTNVETVIVYDGPGSWKRRAFWDEYVVSITNRSRAPIRLEGAQLLAADGNAVLAGHDWQELEEESRNWWARHATANNVVLGTTRVVLGAGAGVSLFVTYLAAMGGGAAGLAILPYSAGALIACAGLGVTIDGNPRAKQVITGEFQRRRIELPQSIAPADTVSGSLFFRVTPGPQKLALSYRIDGVPQTLSIDLSRIAGLHLKDEPLSTPTGTPLAPLVSVADRP